MPQLTLATTHIGGCGTDGKGNVEWITKDEQKDTSKSPNHLVKPSYINHPSSGTLTVDNRDTTKESESNQEDKMNSLKCETRNHRVSVRGRTSTSSQLVSTSGSLFTNFDSTWLRLQIKGDEEAKINIELK